MSTLIRSRIERRQFSHSLAVLNKNVFRHLVEIFSLTLLVILFVGVNTATATLTIEPLTWNTIGLDSNNVNVGPNQFPVGARVCTDVAATNLSADFIWDTTPVPNYIINRPGTLTTIDIPSLGAGECVDFYYEVEVSRDAAAYTKTRGYHITITADGPLSVSTPQRRLEIEYLISQSRNSVTDVQYGTSIGSLASVAEGGTMTLMVGNTYFIRVVATTATNGYEQIESFLSIPNTIFQVLSVDTTYTADTSTTVSSPNDKLYGDACVWQSDYTDPNYLSCLSTGKVGGDTSVTYEVKILSVPTAPLVNAVPLNTLIYDFSGSSYHYNADFDVSARFANIITASISKSFSPKTILPGENSTLTFTINNPGASQLTGVNFIDDLPTDLNLANSTVTYSGCGSPDPSPATVSDPLTFSSIEVAGYGTCTIVVTVTSSTDGTYDNTSDNLFIDTTVDTGSFATDTLVVTSLPSPPSSCASPSTIATWTMEPAAGTGTPPLYTTKAADVSTALASYTTVSGVQSIDTANGQPANSWAGTAPSTDPGPPVKSVGWFETAGSSANYFQFQIDTSNYGGVSIAFDVNPINGGDWANPNSNAFIKSSPDGSSFNLDSTLGAGKNAWTSLGPVTATTTGAANTWFRLSFDGSSKPAATILLDNITVTGCPRPLVPTLAKAFAIDPIVQRATSTLTFSLANPNTSALTGVAFSDTLPTGLLIATSPNLSTTCSFGTSPITATGGNSTISLSGATLAASETCTISVDVEGISVGNYTNITSNITSTETGPNTTGGPNVGYGTDTIEVIAPPVITKAFTANPIFTENTTDLTFTIVNPNPPSLTLNGVAFTDTLPAGLDVVTGSSTKCGGTLTLTDNGADPTQDTIALSGGTLAAGASCSFSVTVTGSTAGLKTNNVTVTFDNGGGISGTGNTSTANVLVKAPAPAISLIKQIGPTGSGPWTNYLAVPPGGNIYYRFQVENTGDVPLSLIDISDPTLDNPPYGPPTTSASCSWLDGDGTPLTAPFTLPVADADNNQLAFCALGAYTAVSPGPATVLNTATVDDNNPGVANVSDSDSATYQTTDLSLVKSVTAGSPFSAAGDTISYSYLVTNTGAAALTGPVSIADNKVATVSCPAGDLAPSASLTCTATYTVTAADVNNGAVTNIATATIANGGSPVESNSDTVTVYNNPTYAPVSSFTAYFNNRKQTVLEWTTASEIGTIGFLLERLNLQNGKYQPVSGHLLPGMLVPPHGGTYRFVDTGAKIGRTYTYRLVEVAVNNQGIISGPYTVRADQPLPVNKDMTGHGPTGYTLAPEKFRKKQLKRLAARDQSALKRINKKKAKTGETLKIPVIRNGLVYLAVAELAEYSGLTEKKVKQYLQAKKFLVTVGGKTVSVSSTRDGSALWFYGQAPERRDVSQNIYRLQLGLKGPKLAFAPGKAEEVVYDEQSYTANVQVEENNQTLYFYNINKKLNDFWAWEYLFAHARNAETSHTINTPHLSSQDSAVVRVNLVGTLTSNRGQLDPYKLTVYLNDFDIGTVEWTERGDYQFSAEVAASLLQEQNNVRIVVQLNSGVSYSLIFLDSIEIDYPRSYHAENGELSFSSANYSIITVKGLSGNEVLVLDITDPVSPLQLRTLPGMNEFGEHTMTVLTEPGHNYFLTENIKATVSGMPAVDSPSQLRNSDNRADYLIISPLDLIDSAKRLAAHRNQQGLQTMIVDIEDIQDEFSYGIAVPEAVRDFLTYVYDNWNAAPRYVALIGNGSFDYRDYLGYGESLVPTEMTPTPDGYYPSDNVLADVVGDDGVPEFAVGRIPVVDSVELDSYIDKLIIYEQSLLEARKEMTLVTGQLDPRAGDFLASAAKVAALLPENYSLNQLNVSVLGESATRSQIENALKNGDGIFHYLGHSSWIGLGKSSSLLNSAGIDSMNVVGPPMLMVAMSCSPASFGYPPMNSIGESALLLKEGAAVGFYGATGLSRNNHADLMATGFYRNLFDPAYDRVGDAVVQGKWYYFLQGANRYMLDIYNLLGDPALLIPVRY